MERGLSKLQRCILRLAEKKNPATYLLGRAARRRLAAFKKGSSMPQFLKLGDVWINISQITEVHIELSKDGAPAGCKIKLLGEAMRELADAEIASEVLAFLEANAVKPFRRKES